MLEIDRDGALAGVLGQEGDAHEAPVQLGVGTELACQVSTVAGLDLDDVGAHVGELVAREGTGKDVGQIEHANAAKGVGHVGTLSRP